MELQYLDFLSRTSPAVKIVPFWVCFSLDVCMYELGEGGIWEKTSPFCDFNSIKWGVHSVR